MRLTSSRFSGRTSSVLPCMIRSKPSRMPSTSTPCKRARMVAALMTLLIPGAGPPPTRMASFSLDKVYLSFAADVNTNRDSVTPAAALASGGRGRFLGAPAGCRRRRLGGNQQGARAQRFLDDAKLPADLGAHPRLRLVREPLAQEDRRR